MPVASRLDCAKTVEHCVKTPSVPAVFLQDLPRLVRLSATTRSSLSISPSRLAVT